MTIAKPALKRAILRYLRAKPNSIAVVQTWAWAYRTHANQITPAFKELVRDGAIEVAYVSGEGNNVYRAFMPRL